MRITERNGIYFTDNGLELLAQEPSFVEDIWKNPKHRKHWKTSLSDRELTKVFYEDKIFISKNNAGIIELEKYNKLEAILQPYNHLHLPTLYMADETNLLMDHYPFAISNTTLAETSLEEINDLAIKEYSKFLDFLSRRAFFHYENGILPNKDILFLDPHL